MPVWCLCSGCRVQGVEIGGCYKCFRFFFFPLVSAAGNGEQVLFLTVKPHQHSGTEGVIQCHLRDPSVGKDVPRVSFECLNSCEAPLALLHQVFYSPNRFISCIQVLNLLCFLSFDEVLSVTGCFSYHHLLRSTRDI